jgi:putative DNA primase/helicase
MMTKVAGVEYIKGATHPDWDKALEAIPGDVRDWYQLRLGQAITGHMTPDDLLIVCQGGGRNGKSTINETTAKAAGGYFLMASDRILMANPDNHPTELMDLQGVRYVVAEETPEARRLAVSRLKKTIGTPQITARKVHKDSVTFDATHSFFLSTNYRPIIEETDTGTWERVALTLFPYRYRKSWQPLEGPNDRRGDEGLRARCSNDPRIHSAALAWMIKGASRWYEADKIMPAMPDRVKQDTEAWRKESDQVLQYIDDKLEFDADRHIATQDMLSDLNEWLGQLGHHKWSDKTMVSRFGDHSAFAERHVERKRTRYDKVALSRPGELGRLMESYPLPQQYTAWAGVRFKNEKKPDAWSG